MNAAGDNNGTQRTLVLDVHQTVFLIRCPQVLQTVGRMDRHDREALCSVPL